MTNHLRNYHSHIYLCNHAGGVPIDYVKEALKHNYLELGISDHAPMPILDPISGGRMTIDDFSIYLNLLEEANDYAKTHNIKLYKGLEIEYFSNVDIYERYLENLDYLILGQHYIVKENTFKSVYKLETLEDVVIYRDTLLEALQTGYFNMLCHLDLCFYNIKEPTKEMYETLRPVIKLAKELNIPIEFNANGIRRSKYEENNEDVGNYRYPRLDLFKIVYEEKADVIVSSDAHSVKDYHDWAITKSYELLESLKIKPINKLNMNYYKK